MEASQFSKSAHLPGETILFYFYVSKERYDVFEQSWIHQSCTGLRLTENTGCSIQMFHSLFLRLSSTQTPLYTFTSLILYFLHKLRIGYIRSHFLHPQVDLFCSKIIRATLTFSGETTLTQNHIKRSEVQYYRNTKQKRSLIPPTVIEMKEIIIKNKWWMLNAVWVLKEICTRHSFFCYFLLFIIGTKQKKKQGLNPLFHFLCNLCIGLLKYQIRILLKTYHPNLNVI